MRVLLVAHDNDSYTHFFPQGTAYLAATLRVRGFEVEIYNQDVHHYPDKHLTDYLDNNRFDFIGCGVIGGYYQYRKLLRISEAVNRSKNRPFYILGGHASSPEPEYFLRKTQADAVIIGEGEQTIVSLLQAVAQHRNLRQVKGIAYRDGNDVVISDRRSVIEDIDNIPLPAYDLFPMLYYRMLRNPNCSSTDFVMPMLSGRGCKFECNFCYRMDKGLRLRSNEAIIDEISRLRKDYGITYIVFTDELLMSSAERTISLCESLIRSKLCIRWACSGRLNYAQREVLELMKESGCVYISYGIESMDDQILRNMNKALTTKQIIKGVEATLSCGISPGLNIIFGNIGETIEILRKGVEFLIQYSDNVEMRTIRPVTPYPGSPLYYYAIEKGLLKDCEDFYENKHINSDLPSVNFTELTDEEFCQALLDANGLLIKDYYNKILKESLASAKSLYLDKNADFRGFRQI